MLTSYKTHEIEFQLVLYFLLSIINISFFKGVGLGFFLKSKNGPFLTIFGLILAMFLTSQPYDFDAIAHIGL